MTDILTIFALGSPWWTVVLRTALVYLVILVGLRLAGKREIGQLTIFDLAVLLLISNAVQNAMVGPDSSLTGGVLAAVTLLVMNAIVATLRLRWGRLRYLLEGTATVLILHGAVIPEHLRREGLDQETLAAALREHGVGTVAEVEMAVLETDGSISVVPGGQQTKRLRRPPRLMHK